jgi:hypothetical protein
VLLMRAVVPFNRSRTKMSGNPFVSVPARLFAKLSNATKLPSPEIETFSLALFPCTPPESTLTRSVVPSWRSRTKMSPVAFESPGTRLLALLWNAT